MIDTATTQFRTPADAQAWLQQYTEKHRDLAGRMDALASNYYYYASCMSDEAARAYDLLVGYARGDLEDLGEQHGPGLVADAAIALMRELGGVWTGDGCLYQTAYGVPDVLNPDQGIDLDHVVVNQWATLEELAAKTGRSLPST